MWVVEGCPSRFSLPLQQHPGLPLGFEDTYVDGLPPVGSSLGSAASAGNGGSLGMYAQVKIGSEPARQIAITCHHVVTGKIPTKSDTLHSPSPTDPIKSN